MLHGLFWNNLRIFSVCLLLGPIFSHNPTLSRGNVAQF